MNRIKPHHIMFVLALCTLLPVALSATDIPRYNLNVGVLETIPNAQAIATEQADGEWVNFEHVQPAIDAAVAEALANCGGTGATTAWATGPPTQDEPILLCEIKQGIYAMRNYTNGQWRNGTSVTPIAPLAWAKIIPRIEG